MLQFERYKNNYFITKLKNFYYMIFRTRVRRIIITSLAAFAVGTGVTSLSLIAVDKFSVKNGVGGLETAGVPEFKESDLDRAEALSSAGELSEISADFVSDAGADNLDSAAAVYSQDSSSEEL